MCHNRRVFQAGKGMTKLERRIGQSRCNNPVVGERVFALMLAGSVLILDQVSKWWVLTRLMVPPRAIEITSFFNVVLTWNRGISFGLFNNDSPYNSYILTVLSGVVTVALLVWLLRIRIVRVQLALSAVIGGAVGNTLDRLHHDGVVDFLDFHMSGLHWPAFNVADTAITIGAMVLVADALLSSSDSRNIS